jgi:hypothetical protein
MGTCQLKEKILTEKHRSSSIAEVDNPTQKNDLSRNPKNGGQGPHRVVDDDGGGGGGYKIS